MLSTKVLGAALALLSSTRLAQCATAADWSTRSIYQIMTDRFALSDGSSPACDLLKYCGGTWKGIENKLDYIQGMGFSAIQISPVVKNFAENTIYGEAFHGYWVKDWYDLNENFGTAQDLKDLSKAVHDRGMLLMVDVVINNMAFALPAGQDMTAKTQVDYTQFKPFDKAEYYHSWCNISDWNNDQMTKDCWFSSSVVALPDLDTKSPSVQTMANTWVKELISNYSIDGLRVDAAKHVDKEYLTSFVEAAEVFTLGEVYTVDPGILCSYSQLADNMGLPNFAVYYPLIDAFSKGNMNPLGAQISQVRSQCKSVATLGSFSENHDLPRFATIVPGLTLAKNVVAFTMLTEGIPTMYQLQEQHVPGNYSPYNRQPAWEEKYDTTAPLYNLTATLNKLRAHAIRSSPDFLNAPMEIVNITQSFMITRRGSVSSGTQAVMAYFNSGDVAKDAWTLSFSKGFDNNTEVVEVTDCKTSTTDAAGNLVFAVDGKPKAWFRADKLEGSGLCGRSGSASVSKPNGSTDQTAAGEQPAGGGKTEDKKNSSPGSLLTSGILHQLLGLYILTSFIYIAL